MTVYVWLVQEEFYGQYNELISWLSMVERHKVEELPSHQFWI